MPEITKDLFLNMELKNGDFANPKYIINDNLTETINN